MIKIMEQVDIPLLAGIVLTLILSAFFSGMEIAFVSSNRMLAEMDKNASGLSKKLQAFFYKHANNFVSTMLVGNNIVLVVYGIFIAKLFDNTIFYGLDAGITVPADTVLSTLIVLFTGEFLPKTLFKSNPNRLFSLFVVPAFLFYLLLWPVSWFSTLLSRVVLRIFGIKLAKEDADAGFTKVDLDYLVQTSIDRADKKTKINDEVRIFQNALDFSDTKVRDCMVPRTEICAVEENCSLHDLKNTFIETGKSKLLVYKEDIDHIIGYIHTLEMFRCSNDWHSRIRSIPFVPETMSARKLMQMFMQQKKSLGVVVDEFGGTSGIISLEDIVEEIFGDIEDEHDSQNYTAIKSADGTYILSARLEIDKVNQLFGLDLPESEDYMTVGGLILHEYENFPKLNEIVRIDNFEFKIIKNTMTKIELVKLKVLD